MSTIIEDKLYEFTNFFTDEKCAELIEYIKQNLKKERYKMDIRGFYQNILCNNGLANRHKDYILNVLSSIKPDTQISVSDLIFLTYYPTGQQIHIHRDGQRGKERYKLLIYLNTVPEGGETIFYDDNEKEIARICPIKGNAVLFDLSILHSGEKILTGEKYAIGFRLIC